MLDVMLVITSAVRGGSWAMVDWDIGGDIDSAIRCRIMDVISSSIYDRHK